jgi:hypothetical protein
MISVFGVDARPYGAEAIQHGTTVDITSSILYISLSKVRISSLICSFNESSMEVYYKFWCHGLPEPLAVHRCVMN